MSTPIPGAFADQMLEDPNFATELALIGVTGSLAYGDYGTVEPAGLEPYESPIVNLGWISDEGLTESIAEERNSFTPWQATGPIRESFSSVEFTFSATLWTIGGIANALRYRKSMDDMTYDEAGDFVEFIEGNELPEDHRFLLPIDMIDGDKHRRFILPSASVSERSDVTYTKGSMVGYPFVFRANFDHTAGYSIKRRFREGWRPGYAGSFLEDGVKSPGDWSLDPASYTEPTP